MDSPTDYQIDKANERLQGDWDGDGVVSVHLPKAEARRLLTLLDFEMPAEGRYGYDPIVAPSGEKFWETGEALQVALVAVSS